ncbi:MAG: peptidoglycan DD-metalloendopeptidase family protein [Halioglobus sp.]|nr:peptidoglycan DD-metalloendopeptidase family protein [Halioglobus sp.]
MPLKKRQRGATATGNSKAQASRPELSRATVLAALGLIAATCLFTLVGPPEEHAAPDATTVAEPPAATSLLPVASAALMPAVPEPELDLEPPWIDQTVMRGDNLSLIFRRAGFNDRDLHDVLSQSGEGKSLERIYPGQTIAFQADADGQLAAVRHVRSELETATYLRTEDGYTSEVILREPEAREATATGTITSSLFVAGQEAGLSHTTIMELANIFGGVIDFALDPRKGDTIHVIYEDLYLDGEKYADGNILAAAITNQGTTYSAFRYIDSAGDIGYYNEDGVSMRKAFLLTPVDFTRISSNFNLRRLHPIYKTTRPHRGTDYAAPTGTPVYAAGDGRVIRAGYTRANGNYIFIQHGDQYVTRYLHLHKRKVREGQRVKQSQVIGTVGSTGAATGPHLHYEFLVNGVHRDPRTIHKQLPKAKTLPTGELPQFQLAINRVSSQLEALFANTQLAMANSGGKDDRPD